MFPDHSLVCKKVGLVIVGPAVASNLFVRWHMFVPETCCFRNFLPNSFHKARLYSRDLSEKINGLRAELASAQTTPTSIIQHGTEWCPRLTRTYEAV